MRGSRANGTNPRALGLNPRALCGGKKSTIVAKAKRMGWNPKGQSKEGIPSWLRFEVLKRDGFRCKYCGATSADARLQIDHVKPKAAGGADDPRNLVTACAPCNQGKAARKLSEGLL